MYIQTQNVKEPLENLNYKHFNYKLIKKISGFHALMRFFLETQFWSWTIFNRFSLMWWWRLSFTNGRVCMRHFMRDFPWEFDQMTVNSMIYYCCMLTLYTYWTAMISSFTYAMPLLGVNFFINIFVTYIKILSLKTFWTENFCRKYWASIKFLSPKY